MGSAGTRFSETSFEFFRELAWNNDRDWFRSNKARFEARVHGPLITLLEIISDRLATTAVPLRGGPGTVFRINRDVRFSDDKRPYKESMSALLTVDGTKSETGPLAYIAIDVDGGRIGGGMHQPSSTELAPVRSRIVAEPDAFTDVVRALARHDVQIDLAEDHMVKTMPRGFSDQAAHPHADYVRLKQILAFRPLPISSFLDDSAVERAVEAVVALQHLYAFIDEARARFG